MISLKLITHLSTRQTIFPLFLFVKTGWVGAIHGTEHGTEGSYAPDDASTASSDAKARKKSRTRGGAARDAMITAACGDRSGLVWSMRRQSIYQRSRGATLATDPGGSSFSVCRVLGNRKIWGQTGDRGRRRELSGRTGRRPCRRTTAAAKLCV